MNGGSAKPGFTDLGRTRRAPRSRAAATVMMLAAALFLLVVNTALAAKVHQFQFSFGASGSSPSNPNPLSNPRGVAVDASDGPSSGDVYVTDPANSRVEKFDAGGNFLLMFGASVDKTTGENVCTAASGDTCQAGIAGTAPGEFVTPAFVAVDSSSGPSSGDVYVGDTGDNTVSKFDSTGHLISAWGTGGVLNFNPLYGIAVDPTGNLFLLGNSTSWYEQSGTLTAALVFPEAHPATGSRSMPKTTSTRWTDLQK